MELVIKVRVKTVYGNDIVYPVCDKALAFAKLVRQRTLTWKDIDLIKSLGYTIEVIPEYPNTL